MPKGSKLKELWADPEWRAQRLKDLRENRKWIKARTAAITDEQLLHRIRMVRKRRAVRKNYDLERENATLLWLLSRIRGKRVVALHKLLTSPVEPENRPSDTVNLPAGPYIQRVEELEETVLQMKRAFTSADRDVMALSILGLSAQAAKLVCALLRREFIDFQAVPFVIAPDDADKRTEVNPTAVISNARRVLKKHGIEIVNVLRQGYYISPEHKTKLKSLMDRQFLKQAAE